MFVRVYLFIVPALICIFFGAHAQDSRTYMLSTDSIVNKYASLNRSYQTGRIENRPKIDGKLDDACWKTARWDGQFIQQQPQQAGKPSRDTYVAIVFDSDNLYVALKCFDEAKHIRSVLSRRDEYGGDAVGIALDTYGDNRTAFEFNVTAAGQKIDFMHVGPQEYDENWEAIWEAESAIQDSLWTVEMRIPFSQLRFARGEEKNWGLHIWRWIDRLQEEDHWKLLPIDAPALVYLFGDLTGIQSIRQKRKLELLPYLNLKYSPNTDLKGEWNEGAGLDGKLGLSPDFTLDFSVNPDFGQVEADPSILSLKTYEVFYDEKRPFFLEGNNVFDYTAGRDLLFYSRRIGHAPSLEPTLEDGETMSLPDNTSIINALKLTGKTKDGLSVGFMHSLTSRETATIYNTDSVYKATVEPYTNYTIGRVKQDFNKGNTVLGGIVTSVYRNIQNSELEFLPKSALTGGIDFIHNWKKRKYFVDFKSFFSQIKGTEEAIASLQLSSLHFFQRPDANHLDYDAGKTELSGHGGTLKGGKRSGKFRANASFAWRSPGVNLNDVGYVYQTDYLEETAELRYQVNKPKGIWRDYWFRLTQLSNWTYGGELSKQELAAHTYLRFRNLWNVHFNLERDYNVFDTKELRGGPMLYKDPSWDSEIFIQSNPSKNLFTGFGTRFVFGDDQVTARNITQCYLMWRLGKNLNISNQTVYQRNVDYHQYAGRVNLSDGNKGYIIGQIDQDVLVSTLRIEYFLTPEFSLQYYASPYASIGKYSDFRRVNQSQSRSLNERYISLTASLDDGIYTLTEQNDSYRIYNPDFTFKELNSNLILRWEYRPGSTLFFVWNNTIYDYLSRTYESSIRRTFGHIFDSSSQNVFMLKFTYWFSL